MIQQINFLKSFPKQSQQLPALWIGAILGSLLALLFLVSMGLSAYKIVEKKQLTRAQQQTLQAAIDYQRLAAAYPLLAEDKPLVDRVGEFEKDLRNKESQFQEITHATLRKPFSRYMQALSLMVPEGLWLSNININQDTDSVSLQGFSVKPLFVSVLLQELQKATAFSNVVFDLFYVKAIKNKSYIQFEIANKKLRSYEEDQKEKMTSVGIAPITEKSE
jgi:Tfp pilus assembly protein PilN